jgi:hypothetical protein
MLGLEALIDGKFAQLIRRVVDLTHFLSAGYAVLNPSLSLVARFFAAIPAIVFGLFALLPWFAVVSAVVSGAEEGIVLHPSVDKLVNYFSFYTRSLGTKVDPANEDSHSIVEDVLREEFGYTNVPAAEFQKKFRIVHREELSDQKEKKETTSKWMPALWMGPLVSGVITRALMAIPVFGNYVAIAVYKVFGDTEAAAAAEAAIASGVLAMTPAGAALGALGVDPIKMAMAAKEGGLAGIAGAALQAAAPGASNLMNAARNPAAALQAAVPGASNLMNAARNPAAALLRTVVPTVNAGDSTNQRGGARSDALSTESKVLGAALFALIVGGGIKGVIDHVVQE